MESQNSILFVCTGNLYRSPLAAAFFADLLQRHGVSGWLVESAGTWTISKQRLPPEAISYGELMGLDLRAHTTRRVSRQLLHQFDIIVVMERGHKEALGAEFPEIAERVYMLTEMLQQEPFDIPDPVLTPSQREYVLGDMLDVIRRAFPRIVQLAQSRGGSAA
jgi:protein-tyrosine phosphatase